MTRIASVSWCVLVLLAAFPGESQSAAPADLSVQVTYVSYPSFSSSATTQQVYALTCNPPAGTLPLAARICRDINAYPAAMLSPRQVGPKAVCDALVHQAWVLVVVTTGGASTQLSGSCNDPGGVAVKVFLAAVQGDQRTLDVLEAQLPCDENPVLLGDPTRASVLACMQGPWTAGVEGLIATAVGAPAIVGLHPKRLFPGDVGARPCTIPAGRSGPRTVSGQCGVVVDDRSLTAVVTFVEYWGTGELSPLAKQSMSDGSFYLSDLSVTQPRKRSSWRVVVERDRVVSVTHTGETPPQLQS